VGALVALLGLGAHHALARVVLDQVERDAVQRCPRRRDLREDLDTATIVADHSLDPAHLALDPAQALQQRVLLAGVAGLSRHVLLFGGLSRLGHAFSIDTPWGYL
jgi:hypothetical protein